MIYRKLGKTGLSASVLGLGTMRLPIRKINPDFKLATDIIQYSIEKGINFFDVGTFYCHGHCEKAFGFSIKDLEHNRILTCGKNASHQSCSLDWIGQLENSLKLFNRPFFDLYFIHYLTLEQWNSFFIDKNIIEQIKIGRDKGFFHHLGFSSHDSPENVKKLIDSGWFEAVILSYNILNKEYEATLKYAFEKGIGVVIMNPLAGGALAKANFFPDKVKQFSTSSIELFLNYVLSQPFIHTVLSGMESKKMVDENVRTVYQDRLKPNEINYIDKLMSIEKAKEITFCTACKYCMPCTQGIDIPSIISIWNRFAFLKVNEIFDRDYSMLAMNAECCIKCNLCLEKCPQHIKIPEVMEVVAEKFINT